MEALDEDESVGAIVLTGMEKAFAAGADIKEMAPLGFKEAYVGRVLKDFRKIERIRTPVLAAVSGYALGGGCELAMACDVIYASESAKFGQPEVKLGTIPGAGGTQRLTRAVGKVKAMDMILTGDMIGAQEALTCGLVARVFANDALLDETLKLAHKIASLSKPIIMMAKSCVNQAYESSLESGIAYERRVFEATFGTADKSEGMSAFAEKRDPQWVHK
jgi:enoyl-CoA hydratase